MILKQRGVAAIYFIFLIGAIMSIGVLAIEGSRYIGKKARLGDAMESASIAVAEADITKHDFDPSAANSVAQNWVAHLITDANELDVTTSRRVEKNTYDISKASAAKFTYYRYDVQINSTHDSWFKFSSWPAFDEQVKVANTGAAGRMQGAPVDLVFVADFSESMDNDQRGYHPTKGDDDKIDLLKKIVKDVTNVIHHNSPESTFAFIPFTKRIVIKRKDNGGKERFYCVSPLLSPKGDFAMIRSSPAFGKLVLTMHKKNHKCNASDTHAYGRKERTPIYNEFGFTDAQIDIAEQYLLWLCPYKKEKHTNSFMPRDDDDDCDDDEDYAPNHKCSHKPFRYKNTLRIDYNPTDMGHQWANHIDIRRTAEQINVSKLPHFYSKMPYDLIQNDKFDDDDDGIDFERHCAEWEDDAPEHYILDRRSFRDSKELNREFHEKIKEMEEDGGTDVYQGLLAAPSQFYGATNKDRVIVVLSDGLENSDMFGKLVDAGMCKNIKKAVEQSGSDAPYNAHLLFVQFSSKKFPDGKDDDDEELDHYKSLPVYKHCFGDNIIQANDHDKISEAILDYLTDEIGLNFYR